MAGKTVSISDEMVALLPEVEVAGFTIKPWSFGTFKQVVEPLMSLLNPLKEKGLTFVNIESFFLENGLEVILLLPTGLAALTTMIAVTLRIPEEEVDTIDPEQILIIVATIFSQNIVRLKNSLPLIMGQIKTLVRAA